MAGTALRGALTAIVTPLTDQGALDEASLKRLLAHQLDGGINGLVPVGTTGEYPTLSVEERERVVTLAVEAVRARGLTGKTLIVPGTGSNDTAATIKATRRAAQLGADAALVVAPYYNKPDGRMLEAHYRAVADEGDLPIVVYNVPGRTSTNISADVFLRLCEHPRIIGIKEASANLEQIAQICRERPSRVAVLSGDDAWTLAILAMGGDGIISVASNEIPREVTEQCAAWRAGDVARARAIHERYYPLYVGNFKGAPNPVPVKAGLKIMGIIASDMVRRPLLPFEADDVRRVGAMLRSMDLVGVPA
ncbi:MAG: 4-hydroxy-tetrahydrodipicolinate synthase [Chloroflexi bacterium]|nr:4-hydroxy-tetrahydrodipicolinate synthase [Chloroflexota bacterium]